MKTFEKKSYLILLVWITILFLHQEVIFANENLKKINDQYSVGTLFSYHMFMNYQNYRPKITKNGRVVVSPIFLRVQKTFEEDELYSHFTGNDSLGYPLVGIAREFTIFADERASSSAYLGLYFIYDRAWKKEVNHPNYYGTLIKDYVAISTPLAGVRNSLIIHQAENYKLSLELFVSIGLLNAGIFFNF